MGCFFHYCPCQEARPSLTEEDIERGNKKREMDQMSNKQYIKEKGYNVAEMWECEWWNLYRTTTCVKEHLRESFPYKRPLREETLLERRRSGFCLFMYNVTLKCLKSSRRNLLILHPFSKIQT